MYIGYKCDAQREDRTPCNLQMPSKELELMITGTIFAHLCRPNTKIQNAQSQTAVQNPKMLNTRS